MVHRSKIPFNFIIIVYIIMVRIRRDRGFRRHRRRAGAQRTIASAWRRRNQRRKGGLVARTAASNRRNIKKINRNIETKVIDSVECTIASRFGGQYLQNASVGHQGTFLSMAGTPNAVLRPFSGMGNGDLQSQRTGSFVNVKSLTYKMLWTCATGVASRVGVYIVLDRNPTDDPPELNGLITSDGVLTDGALPTELSYLRFQNMNTCSPNPTCRFKVLKHLQARVSSTALNAPSPPTALMTGTLKYHYKLRYDSEAGSIEPTNQQLLFFLYSDSSTAITSPTCQVQMRLRFKDA